MPRSWLYVLLLVLVPGCSYAQTVTQPVMRQEAYIAIRIILEVDNEMDDKHFLCVIRFDDLDNENQARCEVEKELYYYGVVVSRVPETPRTFFFVLGQYKPGYGYVRSASGEMTILDLWQSGNDYIRVSNYPPFHTIYIELFPDHNSLKNKYTRITGYETIIPTITPQKLKRLTR